MKRSSAIRAMHAYCTRPSRASRTTSVGPLVRCAGRAEEGHHSAARCPSPRDVASFELDVAACGSGRHADHKALGNVAAGVIPYHGVEDLLFA